MANLNPEILDVIVCPVCKGKLQYDKNAKVLICKFDKLKFSIKDGTPIMIENEAKPLNKEDV